MGKKTVKETQSDGTEIISIGKLYAGPWDKKYWSSSRGKDRYPYPVGYKSVRAQNGVTYTMEILEGLKGPSFMISSSDDKLCSGDTPDIAWENFQKKNLSKLWHGKRSSCKIDGVEFFGLKNTYVQRFLRELVARVGGTAEQNLSPSNLSRGVCGTVNEMPCKPSIPDPNFLTCLVKSHVKGKRSKIEKVGNHKRPSGTKSKQNQQEKCVNNSSSSNSKQIHQSSCGYDPSTFAASHEAVLRPGNSAVIIENEIFTPVAEGDVQLNSVDVSDNLKVGDSLFQEDRELNSSTNHFESNTGNLVKNQEPEFNNIIPEERDRGVTNVQHDLSVMNDADLFAPDTLDHAGERYDVSSPKNDVRMNEIANDAIVKDVAKYEVLVTDSFPAYETNSEKSDTDSVGQEIAKSMMTVLLPRAVPLLKTFTRKKRKTQSPLNVPTLRSMGENSMPNTSENGATIDRVTTEHSYLGKNKEASTASTGHDLVISITSNSNSMVPDSVDSDDPQPGPPHADDGKADRVITEHSYLGKYKEACTASTGHDLVIFTTSNSDSMVPDSLDSHDPQPGPPHADDCKADTRIADDTLVMATDIGLANVKEIVPKSKRARWDRQPLDKAPPIHASTMQGISRSSNACMLEKSEASFAKLCKDTGLQTDVQLNVKLNSNPQSNLKLFACYVQPMPISMVQLIVKENEVFVCVTCGYWENKERSLFFYKAVKNGENTGCPSLIGHMPIAFEISENYFFRDIAVERSLLQLTPDAQSLVLVNSIRTPYCREGKLHCSCPACTSVCFEKNAVIILKVNKGYASLVTRLEMIRGVCCILVCQSSYLLAAEEGGQLKLWVMNSEWSGQREECYLPTLDCMFTSIVELKTIPNSGALVVGHNGFGEFGLWNIDKRNLLSKFSSPGMSVSGFVPVGIFRWQRKGECKRKALRDEIMDATRNMFSGRSENHAFSLEDKDVAVWVLISTDRDSESYESCNQEEADRVGCWRLALLVNNTVIIGSIIDEGVGAVTSVDHGILGRSDGLVYTWELSTGMKQGNLHSFKGSRVSCITSDPSNTGALAVASEGQLLVYLQS